MVVAGIIGESGKMRLANLICSILSHSGKKVSVVDSTTFNNYDTEKFNSYVTELDKSNVDILILKLNSLEMINEKIKFDVMIYADKDDVVLKDRNTSENMVITKILSLLNENGVLIANIDNGDIVDFAQEIHQYIITYGFNRKAVMTASSIGDTMFKDNFICCLQQPISAKDGIIIEPQEYKINFQMPALDSHNVLAAATFAIVNGVDLNTVKII